MISEVLYDSEKLTKKNRRSMTSKDAPETSPFTRPEHHEEMVKSSTEVMRTLVPRQHLNASGLLTLGSLLTWLEQYPNHVIECRCSLAITYHNGDEDYSQTHDFTWSIIDERFDFNESRLTSEKGVGSDSESLTRYVFEAPAFFEGDSFLECEEVLQRIREFLAMGAKVTLSHYD